MNEQSRINATIAYFFLGPLFLLARNNESFSDPFVRGHARRASIIIAMGVIILGIYLFLFSSFFRFSLFGFSINSLIVGLIMGTLSLALLFGAYRAYHGTPAGSSSGLLFWKNNIQIGALPGDSSEEEKIRILASYIPFIGIYISAKNPGELSDTGKKIGSFFMALIFGVMILFGTGGTTLIFFITLLGVVLFIVTAVYLFLYGKVFRSGIYDLIPSYTDIEAYIVASIIALYDFFRIAFGGEKRSTFSEVLKEKKIAYSTEMPPSTQYILPSWVVAIPVLNLITLPSLWKNNLPEYRNILLQGIGTTILSGTLIWIYGWSSPITLIVLFPMVTLLSYMKQNTNIHVPISSIMLIFSGFWKQGKSQLEKLKNQKEQVNFSYKDTENNQ